MITVEALPPRRPIHGQMVLLPTPPPGGFTAADLTRLSEAVDARFELLDGEVLMMAPATHWNDEVIDILKHALRRIAPQALVGATEKGIDLGTTVPEPDVLPEGGYAPTGVFRGTVKVDRPFPINIDLPEVTWLSLRAELGSVLVSPGLARAAPQ